MKKFLKLLLVLIVLAALAAGGVWAYRTWLQKSDIIQYNTESVTRADVASTISATGTVEPEELVNVGAQVNGKIVTFGIDANGKSVDYGSPVKQGMVLANIDDVLYAAEVRSAQAAEQEAQASILSAKASIKQAEAKLALAKNNWERAQDLYPKQAMAKSEYDDAEAEFLAATASKLVSEASLAQAEAQLATAEASLDKASRNLGYCVISSPVDGVIIDRRVSIGQTVVSNMSASSIFLIAKDLKRMQVWVSVNEADIGSIKPGMPVEFTVDAFPNRVFKGEVFKIRLNATMSQNVVTYVVEVATDNSNGVLLPYLTANVKFIRDSRSGVLTIPNAALRYLPEVGQVPGQYREELAAAAELRGKKERIIWVLEGDSLRPLRVKTGLNDGIVTEISGDGLEEGMQVVTGTSVISAEQAAADNPGGSPFLPKPPQRRNRK